jgi:hypothetical protein
MTMPRTKKNQKNPGSDKNDKAQQPAPSETSADITDTSAAISETSIDVTTPEPGTPADWQEAVLLTTRPPTAIEEQVKAAGFSSMGVGPVTAEDTEERQLSDDYMAQILERSRIGTALFYVPILNPVWKVGCL